MKFNKRDRQEIISCINSVAKGDVSKLLIFTYQGEDYRLSYSFTNFGHIGIDISKIDYENEEDPLINLFTEHYFVSICDHETNDELNNEYISLTEKAFDSLGIEANGLMLYN
ncbi:MAG: hypothetical protein IJ950_01675 [Helicobacter sp.]|nr:hypothetical protein [Helicobacter sp.]